MRWLKYIPWLIWQIGVGAFALVLDALRPTSQMQPLVTKYPLRLTSDLDITVFACSITMTPGTIAIGLEETAQGKIMVVHALFGADEQEVHAGLADMEARINPKVVR